MTINQLHWLLFALNLVIFILCSINVYMMFRKPKPPKS